MDIVGSHLGIIIGAVSIDVNNGLHQIFRSDISILIGENIVEKGSPVLSIKITELMRIIIITNIVEISLEF